MEQASQYARRIWLAFTVTFVMMAVLGGTSLWMVRQSQESTELVLKSWRTIDQLNSLSFTLSLAAYDTRAYIATGDGSLSEELARSLGSIDSSIVSLHRPLAELPEGRTLAAQLEVGVANYEALLRHLIEVRSTRGQAEAEKLMGGGAASSRAIRRQIGAVRQLEHQLLDRRMARQDRTTLLTRQITIYGMALGLIVLGLAAMLIKRALDLVSAIVNDLSEARSGLQALNQDLEQRAEARAKALTAVLHEIEGFTYTLSHDLRAPLRAVDGFSHLALSQSQIELPAPVLDYLREVRSNARTMSRLLEDLLAFARVGRQPLTTRAVAPAVVAHEALSILWPEQRTSGVAVKVGNLPMCNADPALLREVFVHLLANAIKHTREREGALIEVGCGGLHSAGDTPVYFVRDNGDGFDPEDKDKIFQVFERLHEEQEYEGTGVGLAIAQRIVQRHGGQIWAEGALGKGATFYFTLGVHSSGE